METISEYNRKQDDTSQEICTNLQKIIQAEIGEVTTCKIWHGAPVWFSENNPVVGYSVRKLGVQLLFWSGLSFHEPTLSQVGDKYPTAEARFVSVDDVDVEELRRWLKKCIEIQWDYKNIVKRKGELRPLKGLV
ncbi:MAG TPA: DUF1801 domain-containing protein [Candidatus Saccharibacteria bacterium]|nr:DUF1801 domain-containing protein [Candidatus Saccharibacteria bacterium]